MAKNAEAKKEKKVKQTKNLKKKEKKTKVKKESYIAGVKSEISKVKWPSKQEVLKYTIATIVFMVVLAVFFELLTLIMAMLGGA